jgi:peptide/nickel transport system permease protein
MVISFSLIRLTPGDPASARLGAGAEIEAVEQLRAQLGLNVNPFRQFVTYINGLFHGDMGVSLVNDVDVFDTIQRTLPLTLTQL